MSDERVIFRGGSAGYVRRAIDLVRDAGFWIVVDLLRIARREQKYNVFPAFFVYRCVPALVRLHSHIASARS